MTRSARLSLFVAVVVCATIVRVISCVPTALDELRPRLAGLPTIADRVAQYGPLLLRGDQAVPATWRHA